MLPHIKPARQVRDYLTDDSIDINDRLTLFFVNIGIIAAILGLIVALLAHVPASGIMVICIIAVGSPLIAAFTRNTGHQDWFGRIISISLTVLIPAVWLTSGGSTGGTTLWFVYELFYIVLFARNGKLLFNLLPAVMIQIACFVLEAKCPQYVFNFTNNADGFISLTGSMAVITAEICLTVAVQKLIYQHERDINDKSDDFTKNFVTSIANTLDTKDTYTGGHSRRVAVCASAIAARMGMSEEQIQNVHTVALLHDLGKVGVPDRVLNKPGKLSKDEYELIRRHPSYGAQIVKDLTMIPHVLEGVLYHHERYDGKGYPQGLKGEEIPLIARIIAVADSFDAMSTNRIYRRFIPREDIVTDFINCRGTQFDPFVADIFVQMLMDGFVVEDDGSTNIASAEKSLSTAARNMLLRITEFEAEQKHVGATNVDSEEFGQIYTYLRGLGRRYGGDLTLYQIGLNIPQSNPLSDDKLLSCMANLNTAITQCIRSVDVCTRFSTSSYLVMLLNASPAALNEITDRITADFYRLEKSSSTSVYSKLIDDISQLL